jgi:hypothetical protein
VPFDHPRFAHSANHAHPVTDTRLLVDVILGGVDVRFLLPLGQT